MAITPPPRSVASAFVEEATKRAHVSRHRSEGSHIRAAGGW